MQAFPNHYTVTVEGKAENNLTASTNNSPSLVVAAPSEFDGPGDQWSPETLLMSALANCFVLSFRAIAKASHFEWTSIECESTGTLDRIDRKTLFTSVKNKAKLFIDREEKREKAEKLLTKAEDACLVSNSLSCETHLQYEIIVAS